MSAQHATGGYAPQQTFPVGPSDQPTPPSYLIKGTSTPLGRIVLGVFLGLLAWTVVMAIVGVALLATVFHSVDKAVTDSTSSSGAGISHACKVAIDGGNDGTSSLCDSDDTAAVLAYVAAH